MELSQLIDSYQTQAGLIDRIWWYFYSVTFLVLGFTIGSKRATQTYLEAIIICAGYVAFSLGSVASLWNGQKNLGLFADKIIDTDPSFALRLFDPLWVTLFQGVIVVFVVFSVRAVYENRAGA